MSLTSMINEGLGHGQPLLKYIVVGHGLPSNYPALLLWPGKVFVSVNLSVLFRDAITSKRRGPIVPR